MNPRPPSKWRNPVMWLVVGLPGIAVVAGIGMIVVASRGGSNDAIPESVRRTAQVQVADLGPDMRAQRANLSAVVRVDLEQDLVEILPVTGDFDRAAPLRLSLSHPSRSAGDRVLDLAPSETGWRIRPAVALDHDWNLRLGPVDGGWRLQGRLPAGEQAALLRPAVAAPDDGP